VNATTAPLLAEYAARSLRGIDPSSSDMRATASENVVRTTSSMSRSFGTRHQWLLALAAATRDSVGHAQLKITVVSSSAFTASHNAESENRTRARWI
jgi:hypothetical protein